MTDKYNKLVDASPLNPADTISPYTESEIIGTEITDPGDSDRNTAFMQDMTQSEFLNLIYLGAGPHEKGRAPIKIIDPYPVRTSISNPETFFDQTYTVYWDSTWNAPEVYIQATPEQFTNPSTTMSVTTTVIVNVNGAADQTLTPTGATRSGLANFSSTGEYTVRIRLKGTTSVGCSKGLYLVGVAPRDGVWVGVPNIDSSGIISYDMTIQMPEVPGIEDWDVEIAEA